MVTIEATTNRTLLSHQWHLYASYVEEAGARNAGSVVRELSVRPRRRLKVHYGWGDGGRRVAGKAGAVFI